MALSLIKHPDNQHRCSWCGQGDAFADYIHYHDHEWGMPVVDERRLFEKITLEGFQAGLSWITILRKRDRFREVFKQFDFEKVSRFTEKDVDALLQDSVCHQQRTKGLRFDRQPRRRRFGQTHLVTRTHRPTTPRQNHARSGNEADANRAISSLEQNAAQNGLQLRRPHHHVCPDAIYGHRQRPFGRLQSSWASRTSSPSIETALKQF
jgi:DNA-3-methyladenine glycosylase I